MMMMIQMIVMSLIQMIQAQRKRMRKTVLMITKERKKVLQRRTQMV
jgi:hypothetical protein